MFCTGGSCDNKSIERAQPTEYYKLRDQDMNQEGGRINRGFILILAVVFLFGFWVVIKYRSAQNTDREQVSIPEDGGQQTTEDSGEARNVQKLIDSAREARQNEEFKQALQLLGRARSHLSGNEDTAQIRELQILEKKVKKDRKRQEVTKRAKEYAENKNWKKSAELYESLASGNLPEDKKKGYRKKADRYRFRQFRKKARTVLEGDSPDREAAIEYLEKALSYRKDEEVRNRIRMLREEINLAKEKEKFRKRMKKGEELMKDEKFKKAISLYEKLLENAPGTNEKESVQKKMEEARENLRNRRKLYRVWMKKARRAKKEENWSEVRKFAKNANRRLPGREEAIALLEEAKEKLVLQDMVKIPGGTYRIGEDRVPGSPSRTVKVDTFHIDRYEVTNKQYYNFLRETDRERPPGWDGDKFPEGTGDHPVMGVSYNDARAYAEWAGKRLPTEVEWEVAARGTDSSRYPWGDELGSVPANTLESGRDQISSVDRYRAGRSEFNVLNMTGNVSEWTKTKSIIRLEGNNVVYRIVKGGSFLYPVKECRPSNRVRHRPDVRIYGVGFRCVRRE